MDVSPWKQETELKETRCAGGNLRMLIIWRIQLPKTYSVNAQVYWNAAQNSTVVFSSENQAHCFHQSLPSLDDCLQHRLLLEQMLKHVNVHSYM